MHRRVSLSTHKNTRVDLYYARARLEEPDEELDVESELIVLFRSLKQAKPNATDGDQMAYYRTATALMERLLNLQDKAKNIKTMGEHHDLVLRFMEEICSPTQVEEFMTRLKDLS